MAHTAQLATSRWHFLHGHGEQETARHLDALGAQGPEAGVGKDLRAGASARAWDMPLSGQCRCLSSGARPHPL